MKEIEDRPEPARMRGGRAASAGAEPSAAFVEWLTEQHHAMVGWLRAYVNPIHYAGDPPEYWTICGEDDAVEAIIAHLLSVAAASPLGGPILARDDLKSVPVGGDGEGGGQALRNVRT